MAIIKHVKDSDIKYAYLNIFPDQFKTAKEKKKPSWVKNTMDYFANKAYAEYVKGRDTFVKNYDLVKGILRPEDFFQESDVKSFVEMLQDDLDLPAHVKHYSILTTPINELVGEISKRPDSYKVKAFDDDSKAEELQFKTQTLTNFVMSKAKQNILMQAQAQGKKLSAEELDTMTMEQLKDELDNYTSIAEKWGNHMLTASRIEFNIKEKSEDAFRDLLISDREYYHVYEDNSKLGFNVEVVNPKNFWGMTTPDKKYISDPSGRAQGSYAAGTVTVMELSEIIETFPEVTKEEIDHLRSSLEDYGLINTRESNLGNPNVSPGIGSITYDTYDPLVLQTRMIIESEIKENDDGLRDFLGLTSNVSAFGYKYVVIQAYWLSKRQVGLLRYIDEMGNEQSTLVDENYKSGMIPTQISLEWGWINQWYRGLKIGPDIYHVAPYKLLNYLPIIGVRHEIKNTEAISLVDMMKPFQVIYNIAMNQVYELLEKEIGNVASINTRRVPKLKDGDDQDALDVMIMEARERGLLLDDDSPENTKAPVSNQSVARNIDLTRTNEIQSRYTLAQQMKNECWELIGMSKQRLGSVSASESATGTNAAITQSYSQTEPLFMAHEYVLGQLYQAILDASQYVESHKPESTLSYVTSEGEQAFIQVNGDELKLRDLKVYPTNRPEDNQMFQELRQLAQAVLQNGGSIYDIVELYSTNSVREIKKSFRELRDQQQALQNKQLEQKDAEIQQKQQQAAAMIEQEQLEKDKQRAHDSYENELDRLKDKEVALIQASKETSSSTGKQVEPDLGGIADERSKAMRDFQTKLQEISQKERDSRRKYAVEQRKLDVAEKNQANDLAIAKENAKGRNKSSK